MDEKQQVLDERAALLEMYKAGFLDAYKLKNRLRTNKDYEGMNTLYKLAFYKRFGKRITKELKK